MDISSFGFFAIGLLVIVLAMMYMIYHIDSSANATTRHLYFGAVTMCALSLIFILAMGMLYFADVQQAERAEKIFETVKQIVPSFLTLVMGYFFGQQVAQKSHENASPSDAPSSNANSKPSLKIDAH